MCGKSNLNSSLIPAINWVITLCRFITTCDTFHIQCQSFLSAADIKILTGEALSTLQKSWLPSISMIDDLPSVFWFISRLKQKMSDLIFVIKVTNEPLWSFWGHIDVIVLDYIIMSGIILFCPVYYMSKWKQEAELSNLHGAKK